MEDKMEKDVKYYMGLDYPVTLEQFSIEDGGGWEASIEMLGKYAFRGWGETVEEARSNLEVVKGFIFERYIKNGVNIPEPEGE